MGSDGVCTDSAGTCAGSDVVSGGAEGVSADACSDEIGSAAASRGALQYALRQFSDLHLCSPVYLQLKAVSSEAKTLAVPVKDIAAAIVIHKHFVRYLFFIFKRCSLLFMNIPLLPYIKVCILTLKTVRIKY